MSHLSHLCRMSHLDCSMVLLQMLLGKLLVTALAPLPALEAQAGQSFVDARKAGLEKLLPPQWPKPLSDLLRSCWAREPTLRPGFVHIVKKLQQMVHGGLLQSLGQAAPRCGCQLM